MRELAMMIDIETLSLRPDAYVTQVGVCVVDVVTREYLLAPSNCWLMKEGQEARHIDFDTVRWWMTQDREVARGVFEAPEPRNTQWALFNLLKKWTTEYPDMTIWASPAGFDFPILTGLWGGQKPWVYNMERCLMTLYKVIDPQKALEPKQVNAREHDAAADAEAQMEYLLNLLSWQRDGGHRADLPCGVQGTVAAPPSCAYDCAEAVAGGPRCKSGECVNPAGVTAWCTLCGKSDHAEAACPTVTSGVKEDQRG